MDLFSFLFTGLGGLVGVVSVVALGFYVNHHTALQAKETALTALAPDGEPVRLDVKSRIQAPFPFSVAQARRDAEILVMPGVLLYFGYIRPFFSRQRLYSGLFQLQRRELPVRNLLGLQRPPFWITDVQIKSHQLIIPYAHPALPFFRLTLTLTLPSDQEVARLERLLGVPVPAPPATLPGEPVVRVEG